MAASSGLWGTARPAAETSTTAPREVTLPADAVKQFPADASARELWGMLLPEMQARGITRAVTVIDTGGKAPWAVEYRAVREAQGALVSIVNLWGTPQTVRLSRDGAPVQAIHDLRRDTRTHGDVITLQPLEAMVLRVR